MAQLGFLEGRENLHGKTPWVEEKRVPARRSCPGHGIVRMQALHVAHMHARPGVDAFQRGLYAARRILDKHQVAAVERDRESTRLNSSHLVISYAVFCLN